MSAKPLLKHDEESARIRTMAANQLVSLSVLFKSTNLKHLQSQIYPTILLAELELRHTHNARYILQHMAEDQADLNIYHFAAFQVLLNVSSSAIMTFVNHLNAIRSVRNTPKRKTNYLMIRNGDTFSRR